VLAQLDAGHANYCAIDHTREQPFRSGLR
jgi:hypothetical protein